MTNQKNLESFVTGLIACPFLLTSIRSSGKLEEQGLLNERLFLLGSVMGLALTAGMMIYSFVEYKDNSDFAAFYPVLATNAVSLLYELFSSPSSKDYL